MKARPDHDIIREAYEEALKNLFRVLADSGMMDVGGAEDRFKRGVRNARAMRDLALKIVEDE